MHPAHDPGTVLAAALIAATILLVGTISGRILLRRIAMGLAVVALAVIAVAGYLEWTPQ